MASTHCKCETVTIQVFSRVSLPAVLKLLFKLLVVGHITSNSCSMAFRCNVSNYWNKKEQLEYN